MTTPRSIEWLDSKMAHYDKLIPPGEVLEAELTVRIEAKVRAPVTERILREAGIEDQVVAAVAAIKLPSVRYQNGFCEGLPSLTGTRRDVTMRAATTATERTLCTPPTSRP